MERPEELLLDDAPQASERKVEKYINLILKNENLNIRFLPDWLERKLYKLAIFTVLNRCLKAIYRVNGLEIFGHHLRVKLEQINDSVPIHHITSEDRAVIKDLVGELMKDSNINISWLPDSVEKDIYEKVLLVSLMMLEIFFSTSKIEILGHVFEAKLSDIAKFKRTERTGIRDIDKNSKRINKILEKEVSGLLKKEGFRPRSWVTSRLEKSLFKHVFVFVLLLIDEVTNDTKIEFMGNQIVIQVCPGKAPPKQCEQEREENTEENRSDYETDVDPSTKLTEPPSINEEQVDAYVKQILRNKNLNVRFLPDQLEGEIYKFAIQEALGKCIKTVYTLNGVEFLGHHLRLKFQKGKDWVPPIVDDSKVDREAIRVIIKKLLKNSDINMSLLLDAIEEELYVNIISMLFIVIQVFLSSIEVEVIGHKFEAKLARRTEQVTETAPRTEQVTETVIDSQHHQYNQLNKAISYPLVDKRVDIFLSKRQRVCQNFLLRALEEQAFKMEEEAFKMIFRVALLVTNEITNDVRVGLFGDCLTLQLWTHKSPKKKSKNDEEEKAPRKVFCCCP